MTNLPPWASWAERLQLIAQAGLTYSQNQYDLQRFSQIQALAAEILAEGSATPIQKIEGLLADERGYQTPKVDVRAVVVKEGKMLFVKELADGGWTLPGGWVDAGDRPSFAAEREVWEESGYTAKATRLLAVLDHRLHGYPPYFFHIFKLFFQCELTGGKPGTSLETGGVAWFGPQDSPKLSLERTTPEIIRMMFTQLEHPEAPALFD
ncbi:MAG: NUDIX hydrolase [Anaerolineaceae bacterium]|nr:NUDIX hydrolase [Anaerolineaceae bacterium]